MSFERVGQILPALQLGVDKTMKKKRIIITILLLLVFIGLLAGGRYYYFEHIKYAYLEREIRQVHKKMEADFPKEALEQAEHFGVGMAIRDSYGLWKEDTKIRKDFENAGVMHPDDMSGLLMDTYIRSKKGVPFKLHRLISLQAEVYKHNHDPEYLTKLIDEFYMYKPYRKEWHDKYPRH